jgi:uroporphyrinogen decarboxylase
MLTHKERLQTCLSAQTPDRPPVALWRHFPIDDQTPDGLAAAALHFQRTYDFDLVKVTPSSSFCLKDWGVEDEWQGDSEGTRRYTRRVIHEPQDWEKLRQLPPSSPHLSDQLTCLRQIRRELGLETPVIQTIFSPLSQAKNLAGGQTLLIHIRKYPEAVLKGLEVITKTTLDFIEAARETGIDGIFYAVQHAQAGLLSRIEFQQFEKAHDLTLLESARDLWCNLVHLHGDQVYFDLVSDYPAQILNWHDRDTPPSLRQAQEKYNGVVCGGLSRETIVLGTPAQVRQEAADAITQTAGKRFMLGTGCVVPIIAPHGNLLAARQSVEAG